MKKRFFLCFLGVGQQEMFIIFPTLFWSAKKLHDYQRKQKQLFFCLSYIVGLKWIHLVNMFISNVVMKSKKASWLTKNIKKRFLFRVFWALGNRKWLLYFQRCFEVQISFMTNRGNKNSCFSVFLYRWSWVNPPS